MNSTKSALLKRQYNRQRMIANASRLILAMSKWETFLSNQSIFMGKPIEIEPRYIGESIEKRLKRLIELTSVSAEQAADNINVALMVKDKTGISVISGQRIKKTQDYRIATAEEAVYEELEDKNLLFAYYSGEWSFYEKLRAYHIIEITIAIAVGVYLWLK